jgi:hypothetical protein
MSANIDDSSSIKELMKYIKEQGYTQSSSFDEMNNTIQTAIKSFTKNGVLRPEIERLCQRALYLYVASKVSNNNPKFVNAFNDFYSGLKRYLDGKTPEVTPNSSVGEMQFYIVYEGWYDSLNSHDKIKYDKKGLFGFIMIKLEPKNSKFVDQFARYYNAYCRKEKGKKDCKDTEDCKDNKCIPGQVVKPSTGGTTLGEKPIYPGAGKDSEEMKNAKLKASMMNELVDTDFRKCLEDPSSFGGLSMSNTESARRECEGFFDEYVNLVGKLKRLANRYDDMTSAKQEFQSLLSKIEVEQARMRKVVQKSGLGQDCKTDSDCATGYCKDNTCTDIKAPLKPPSGGGKIGEELGEIDMADMLKQIKKKNMEATPEQVELLRKEVIACLKTQK